MELFVEGHSSKLKAADTRLTEQLSKAWKEKGKVYGYCKLHDDPLHQGEKCYLNRVADLIRLALIRAQAGYRRCSGSCGGKTSMTVDNSLGRQFNAEVPDRVWVAEITYNKTLEDFSYLAVVINLFSHRVVGWSMQSR